MILTATYGDGGRARFPAVVPGSVRAVEPSYWAHKHGERTAIEFQCYGNAPVRHTGIRSIELEREEGD
jgi:hypothetical protein